MPHENGIRRMGCRCSRGPASPVDFSPITTIRRIRGGNRVSRWCATYFGTEENIQRLQRARMFAREHHVTVAQVALAYVLCHPLQAFAVVGCTTFEKFAENVAALSLKLDEATLHWLATGQASQ